MKTIADNDVICTNKRYCQNLQYKVLVLVNTLPLKFTCLLCEVHQLALLNKIFNQFSMDTLHNISSFPTFLHLLILYVDMSGIIFWEMHVHHICKFFFPFISTNKLTWQAQQNSEVRNNHSNNLKRK